MGKPVRIVTHALSGALLGCALLAVPFTHAQAPQTQTTFRASTLIIPVDVRVLTRDGKPVTDLKAEDFTILENGVPQTIRHFSAGLTPQTSETDAPLRRRTGELASLEPQKRRLFLIVLGRGRLQEPSKGMDALLRFVRDRLMPQDQVAVMAWNRATDFTSDHSQVASVLLRFRARHEDIETDLSLYFSGLTALYGSKQIPRTIQTKIDDVFNGPFTPPTRQILPGTATARAEADAYDVLQRKSEIEARIALTGTDRLLLDLMADNTFGMDFEEYVALSRQTMQDVGNLYAGIDYLRFIEGEKHLIFVTEQGFLMPSADYDRDIGALASDARVAIDTIQTGGVATTMINGFPQVSPVNGFALSSLRTVSERSGGLTSVSGYADNAIDRILSATEFGYLLGYAPSNTALDGGFRKIAVEVQRRGVTISSRRGYFARPAEDFDPRKSLAMTRMVTAANYRGDVRDLKVDVKVASGRTGSQRFVTVDTTIAADRLVFATVGGRTVAAINHAVLCTDDRGANLGELWRTLDVEVPDSEMAGVKKNGLTLSVRVPVTLPPSTVKVIVYDYGADLIGTTFTRVR